MEDKKLTNDEAIKVLDDLKVKIDIPKSAVTQRNRNIALDMAIQAIEEQRWIPVSERLPKKTGWYFITFKVYGGDYAVSEMCYRKPENYWTDKDISKKVFDNNDVLAWKPLPQPYKEGDENE